MIGVLGNFFIGERLFKVTLQLSLENEKKALNNQRRLIRGNTRELPIKGRKNDPPIL